MSEFSGSVASGGGSVASGDGSALTIDSTVDSTVDSIDYITCNLSNGLQLFVKSDSASDSVSDSASEPSKRPKIDSQTPSQTDFSSIGSIDPMFPKKPEGRVSASISHWVLAILQPHEDEKKLLEALLDIIELLCEDSDYKTKILDVYAVLPEGATPEKLYEDLEPTDPESEIIHWLPKITGYSVHLIHASILVKNPKYVAALLACGAMDTPMSIQNVIGYFNFGGKIEDERYMMKDSNGNNVLYNGKPVPNSLFLILNLFGYVGDDNYTILDKSKFAEGGLQGNAMALLGNVRVPFSSQITIGRINNKIARARARAYADEDEDENDAAGGGAAAGANYKRKAGGGKRKNTKKQRKTKKNRRKKYSIKRRRR
jgi:hypothetical protein